VKMTPNAAINCWKVHAILGDNPFRASFTLHPLLKNLRIPTLIIHGDDDPVPKITAQNIHRSIQDSKYVEIKNCGHFPFIEQPEEYFRVLKNFLN
jgi:proline iminopeptidase